MEPAGPHASESPPEDSRSTASKHTSALEWLIAVASLLLVLAAAAILAHDAITRPETPPSIELTVHEIRASAGGYVVVFEARNRGYSTAAGLLVEGVLEADGAEIEKSSTTLDYVPSRSRRRGGLFFSHDPRAYQLTLMPRGYDAP